MSKTTLSLPRAPERAADFGHDALVVCDNLVRIYQTGSVEVQALQGLDLLVGQGEMACERQVTGLQSSTRKHIFAGHKGQPRRASAHQQFRNATARVEDDERAGIAGS